MSEGRHSGINRAFSWLKKTLQITEKTVAPDSLSPVVTPTMDLFGWERVADVRWDNNTGALAADIVIGALVPDEIVRIMLAASVQSDDALTAMTLWLEQRVASSAAATTLDVGVAQPFFVGVGLNEIEVPLMRPLLMAPGDRLIGRSAPAPAAGQILRLRTRFIDLPIGEYLPSF